MAGSCQLSSVAASVDGVVRRGVLGDPTAGTIKVLTLHTSKEQAFPVVALLGAGQMPAAGEDEHEEAKLFYVGATQRLILGAEGDGRFGVLLAGWSVQNA